MSSRGLELVVIGCSWGGLAAMSSLLEALPQEFEVPIVFVQHRGEARSVLTELLGRHTARVVVEPDDKDELLPRHVYVAPPGYHLLVDRTGFSLATEGPVNYSRPSVDVLFQSAAEAFAPRMAAVVLTGANDDGAAGLRQVAAAGGMALVQDPGSAERSAMPAAALAAVPTALVADVAGLARLLAMAAAGQEVR